MALSAIPASLTGPWLQQLADHAPDQTDDFPNYYVSDPAAALISTAASLSLSIGSGLSVFEQALIPALLRASHSIVLVTCFWAKPSPTLTALSLALEQLANSRTDLDEGAPLLRVRICFSSRSTLRRLFHTSALRGRGYPPNKWPSLGLPPQEVLVAGKIDVKVRSLFFNPLSIVHPKFIILDEEVAFVPSCNVSWENWLEGCLCFTGDAVRNLLEFYYNVWELDGEKRYWSSEQPIDTSEREMHPAVTVSLNSGLQSVFTDAKVCSTILLPSPHHRWPSFRILPWRRPHPPPVTPLNVALSVLFANACHSICMATPNLTSPSVLSALLDALSRGVNVTIYANRAVKVREQLLTAGTTTSRCLKRLVAQYRRLTLCPTRSPRAVEHSSQEPGTLDILLWAPQHLARPQTDETRPDAIHLKMTVVDGEYVVLGSGNMDRASWYTSQELGMLLFAPGLRGFAWPGRLREWMDVYFQSAAYQIT